MRTPRFAMPVMAGALLLSAAAQADDADSTVSSGQLREQSRLFAVDDGRGFSTEDGVNQRNRVWSMQGVQDGSYTGTPVQTRQQPRMQEELHNREHSYQGGGSGTRYGQGYESRGGRGGYGAGSGGSGRSRTGSSGSSRSGGKSGGRR
jgi:hypothetical protein